MTTLFSICLASFLLSSGGELASERTAPDSAESGCLVTPRVAPRGTETGNPILPGSQTIPEFGEQVLAFRFPQDVRITVNAPRDDSLDPGAKIKLILYALPNGNTTEQTAGKQLREGDDWHFDIQHVAAQTRFLRRCLKGMNIVTVYLETEQKSWPAWRSRHPDSSRIIVSIVDSLRKLFTGFRVDVTLSGHSGGGSFVFGYLNSVSEIPEYVERIALLDANYAYEDSLHAPKLSRWLRQRDDTYLCVLAYDDSIALLNGKPFVSPTGGTWHRSHMMLRKLGEDFPWNTVVRGHLKKSTALAGRVQFLLLENPERAVLHTVQVERNGFIQCIVSGTTYEEAGYQYFGDRAYCRFISAEKHPSLSW